LMATYTLRHRQSHCKWAQTAIE